MTTPEATFDAAAWEVLRGAARAAVGLGATRCTIDYDHEPHVFYRGMAGIPGPIETTTHICPGGPYEPLTAPYSASEPEVDPEGYPTLAEALTALRRDVDDLLADRDARAVQDQLSRRWRKR